MATPCNCDDRMRLLLQGVVLGVELVGDLLEVMLEREKFDALRSEISVARPHKCFASSTTRCAGRSGFEAFC